MALRITIFCFLIFSLTLTTAQQPTTWHLTQEDGLPSNTIYKIVQDTLGYIWMGTANGLCSFDGKVFKKYKGNELADNEILGLSLDGSNTPWALNLSGQLSSLKENVLVPIQPPSKEDYILRNIKIVKDQIWIVYSSAPNRASTLVHSSIDDFKEKELFQFDSVTFMSNSIFTQFGKDKLLFFTGSMPPDKINSALYQIILPENKVERIQGRPYYEYEMIRRVSRIDLENNRQLSNQEIGQVIDNLAAAVKGLAFKNQIKDIIIEEKQLYFLTRTGFYNYQHDLIHNSRIHQITHQLPDQDINAFFKDKEGNIWLGTNGLGVHVIFPSQFIHYTAKNSPLPANSVYCLYYDTLGQQLLLGQNNSFLSVIKNLKVERSVKLSYIGRIYNMIKTHNNRFWVGIDLGLSVLDDALENEKVLFSGSYKSFLLDHDNQIWLGGSGAIIKEDLSKIDSLLQKKIPRAVLKEYFTNISNYRTYALSQDHAKNIWIGTTQGLFQYINDSLVLVKLGINNDKLNVTDIIQSKDSITWISTYTSGVIGLRNEQIIHHFNEDYELQSNTCKTLFYAHDNKLWIGTDNGINIIDLSTLETRWINVNNGLASNEINDIYVDENFAWIATSNGLTRMNLNSFQDSITTPDIYITKVKIFDQDTSLHPAYHLEYFQNNLTIDFLGIYFKNKADLSYKYKMEGIDQDWVSTNARTVRYPLLNPGSYTFKVSGIYDNGQETNPTSVQFVIARPWWDTAWFKVLCAFLLISIISVIFYSRQRFFKQKQEYNNRVHSLKMDALKAQMNPHFIFNSLIAIQKYITTNEQKQANSYLSRFAKLIRMIFNNSDKQAITLTEELEFINTYIALEKLRFGDKVKVQLDIASDLQLESEDILIPPLLIQPVIENAFKHGLMHKEKNGILTISLKRKQKYLICSVKDNGVGRVTLHHKNDQNIATPKASGLNTTKNRLAIWNQNQTAYEKDIEFIDMVDATGKPEGTEVILYIKINTLQ